MIGQVAGGIIVFGAIFGIAWFAVLIAAKADQLVDPEAARSGWFAVAFALCAAALVLLSGIQQITF